MDNQSKNRSNSVYVILLISEVLQVKKFVSANPNYIEGQPCVYVGRTGRTPEIRFQQHKSGYKSNRYAKKYGVRLLPELYECYNPMTYDESEVKEKQLAEWLRSIGYAVWQN